MSRIAKTLASFAVLIGASLGQSAAADETSQSEGPESNPVIWFEIPAVDLDRAKDFYEVVFNVELQNAEVGPTQMAIFPSNDDNPGASGALAQRSGFKPSQNGALIFFQVQSIEEVTSRAISAGGIILMQKTELPGIGFTANIGDTDGNQIALYELN